ncbi:MAG: HlyD family efflux transporter periplasmic adaptor subunit [Gammaproteobacteria bacterium]|nr:HlyD family efflux transporter periplasmic adaptor subunit [Gammaproteobacteria bacterium]MBT4607131.1 HlyD family efflux transporter periplasmic adaptor subunit [Thiotrichales bacterium]MBT3473776.1 HlyD family efflux transporter periplasmic adaptor subunit [Gammaproteobacteria bacterium]MBT3967053.1 HlyD family efflux transporter periplasmic adaptor subunit [Gammaproteobacteria bacterium]MBT4081213.1 HlyD family efflux transporter periplasmic adaptor subunit [Gammaproteobacteria bacterium]
MVNQTKTVAPYQQAILLKKSVSTQKLQVEALANLPDIDRTTPFVQWHEALANHLEKSLEPRGEFPPFQVTPQDMPVALQQQWVQIAPQFLLLLPIGERYTLILGGNQPWGEDLLPQLEHVGRSFAHCTQALSTHRGRQWEGLQAKRWGVAALIVVAATLFLPVSLTAIAPCEVIPHQPFVVTAPFNAVVDEIQIQPNQAVNNGDLLLSLESSDLSSELTIAERKLAVSEARLLKIRQASFLDTSAKSSLSELEAEVALHQELVGHARYRLQQATITSSQAGIAIIDEVERWKGRPVNTGEAILKVANPDIVKVRILLPVSDAITLQQGTPVKVFLDIDPLHPLHAITEHASYEPVTTPDGTVAYHIIAQLSEHNNPPRIGLQGSAKIYGEEVSLFYYLFRRPITALRQWLGW